MASERIKIFYGIGRKVTRVVSCDDDAHYARHKEEPGEQSVLVPRSEYGYALTLAKLARLIQDFEIQP